MVAKTIKIEYDLPPVLNMGRKLIVEYELPMFFPRNWSKKVAEHIGVHNTTVSRSVKHDESSPLYKRTMKALAELYGNPVKQEIIN